MINSEIKTQLDEIFKNAPSVSFNKYVADTDEASQLDEDAKLLAVAEPDYKMFLILHNDVYKVVETSNVDDDLIQIVEAKDDEYEMSIYNEDEDEFEDKYISYEEFVLYAVKEQLFPENNFTQMSQEDAAKYPLS